MCLFVLTVGTAVAQTFESLLHYDYRSLVAHADLSFNRPAPSTHDGLPIGNGRVGTLVWTTPAALHYQINHVDLFCFGNNTLAFSKGHTDYSSGCGYVDINLVDFGNDVFAGDKFNQRLSVYEGLKSDDGDGVKTRSLAWTDGDVVATEVDDQRSHPGTINIDFRMLRYAQNFTGKQSPSLIGPHGAEIRTDDHVAISRRAGLYQEGGERGRTSQRAGLRAFRLYPLCGCHPRGAVADALPVYKRASVGARPAAARV
jgi:hypothetical protein